MDIINKIYSEPEKWKTSECYFTHECGATVWVASGLFFCKPVNGSYSLFNKWKLWRAYKWGCKNAPIESLK